MHKFIHIHPLWPQCGLLRVKHKIWCDMLKNHLLDPSFYFILAKRWMATLDVVVPAPTKTTTIQQTAYAPQDPCPFAAARGSGILLPIRAVSARGTTGGPKPTQQKTGDGA